MGGQAVDLNGAKEVVRISWAGIPAETVNLFLQWHVPDWLVLFCLRTRRFKRQPGRSQSDLRRVDHPKDLTSAATASSYTLAFDTTVPSRLIACVPY